MAIWDVVRTEAAAQRGPAPRAPALPVRGGRVRSRVWTSIIPTRGDVCTTPARTDHAPRPAGDSTRALYSAPTGRTGAPVLTLWPRCDPSCITTLRPSPSTYASLPASCNPRCSAIGSRLTPGTRSASPTQRSVPTRASSGAFRAPRAMGSPHRGRWCARSALHRFSVPRPALRRRSSGSARAWRITPAA